jgi:glycosyltransferase involved in cell wall biosynthesis
MPVKILKVVQSYYPFQERGGPVFKVRALARHLAQRGHKITVLTADLGLKKRSSDGLRPEKCPWGWRIDEDGVEAVYLPSLASYRAMTINSRLRKFCSDRLGQFDIVHFYGLYDVLGPAVGRRCRERGLPYVIEPMGMFRPIDRSFRLKRLWHHTLGKSFIGNASQLVATSELEQKDLLEGGIPREKIVLRYNGVEIERQKDYRRGTFREKWSISQSEPLILFVSRLIPRKAADMLIAAFAKACPGEGKLVIAGPEGEPGYLAYLKKCAEENRVSGRVVFTGPVYDADKTAMYVDSDTLVLASYYENFANVVAEAVACDTPVIVSDKCGIYSLIEGRAGLVVPVDKDALTTALKTLLGDKDLYERLRTGCRQVANELTWGTLSERMENYYSQVLARKNLIQSAK